MLFGLFPCLSFGWQPALELPKWVDLGFRFSSLPLPGKEATIIGEIYTLVGNGEMATVTFELPKGISIISGDKSRVIKLSKGFRKRVTLKIRSNRPCGSSQIKMSLVADYPVSAMKEEIRISSSDSEICEKRIALANSLKVRRTISYVKRLYISDNEVSISDKDVLWSNTERISSIAGVFFVRDFYETKDIKIVKNRLRRFEHYERLLKTSSDSGTFLSGKFKAKRLKKIAQYGEDLHSMAIYYFQNLPADSKRVNKLIDKAVLYSEINDETLVSLKNLSAMVNVQANEVTKAVKIWATLAEAGATGTLTAYMLYNTGEALRGIGKQKESVEFFRAALLERPGLLLARERLRDALSN